MKCVLMLAVSLTLLAVIHGAEKCFTCTSTDKSSECFTGEMKDGSSQDCPSGLDKCFASKASSVSARGCVNQATCDLGKKAADVKGYDGSYSCCDGDDCNGASANMISMAVVSTVALLTYAYNTI